MREPAAVGAHETLLGPEKVGSASFGFAGTGGKDVDVVDYSVAVVVIDAKVGGHCCGNVPYQFAAAHVAHGGGIGSVPGIDLLESYCREDFEGKCTLRIELVVEKAGCGADLGLRCGLMVGESEVAEFHGNDNCPEILRHEGEGEQ